MRWALGVSLALVGCFHPNAATDLPCSADQSCPDGQTCDTQQSPPTCVPGDAGVSGDGAPDTMPIIDCSTGQTCPDAEPVCDLTSHTCRACVADRECAAACEESTGTCVGDARVLYVAIGGDDQADC